jgi:hypothetical protein
MGWVRRRRGTTAAASPTLPDVRDRLDAIERRLDDVEDMARAALAPDRIDELERQVAWFTLHLPTHEDLLEVRLHSARVAGDLAKVTTELRAEIDRTANLLEANTTS